MVTNLGGDDLTSATSTARDPWQEPLSRWHTVPAANVAQAAEVIRGMAGSWAASYQMEYGVQNESRSIDSKVGNPPQVKSNRLGHPGFPEINFAPYNYGTNRFGPKGGSFIGHPISFDVVGPTARDAANAFHWDVVELVNNDELSTSNGALISDIYGHAAMTYFPGGLYVVITQTGSPGALVDQTGAALVGGIGDGCDPSGVKNGLEPLYPSSKYEIFRVTALRADTLVLDSSKRLSDYYTVPADPMVQSIMLVQPQATRLVAIPGSGANRASSKVFAVVPPKRALVQDDLPAYTKWTGAPWTETGLPQYTLGTGAEFTYKYGPKLPVPRPLGYWRGRLRGITPATGAAEASVVTAAGTFILHPHVADPGFPAASLVGKVIHITNVQSRNGATMQSDMTATASDFKRDPTSLMGWFEVLSWSGTYHIVRRVSETDPTTGFPVIGASNWYMTEGSGVPADDIYKAIEVDATVHDSISSLWTSNYADIDAIQSARLTNLIDPRWVERSPKTLGTSPSVPGMDPGRADRAIFDTASASSGLIGTNANPGSLLDLGFRMVLFPAKMGVEKDPAGGADLNVVVPDWNHPVTSNDVLLDPSLPGEKQYVEVDYANGLVRFSHAIKAGSPLYPTDVAVLTATDNPRKEMVVFASCVPYTQEEGQLGAGGVRVVGGQAFTADAASCGDLGASDVTDVFSDRITVPVDGTTGVVASQNQILVPQTVILEGDWVYNIPPAGFFELLSGTSANGPAAIGDTYYRGSLFGYTSVSINVGRTLTTLNGVYGGGEYGVDTINTATSPTVAVFRREVVTPNDQTGRAGVSYAYDTTYGSAKRSPVLRFEDSNVSANVDGSVTVRPKAADAIANFDDLFSSWVLEVGSISRIIDPAVDVTITVQPHVIMMRGHRMTVPTSRVVVNADNTYYIYYEHTDGTTCPTLVAATSFPLPHPEDILLAKIVVSAGVTLAVLTTLQNPLNDVDRRVDLYVGEIGGTTADWAAFKPHFKTLYEAVVYANEIMAPNAGRAYQNVRIRVIGRTQEPASRTITIRTNGLVIEGNPFYDPSAVIPVTSEISWGDDIANVTDLIDINGHSDLVFRNLSFRSNQFGNNAACTASVFTSSIDTARVTIDNCRVSGFVNYFVNLDASTSVTDMRITNNVVMNLNSGSLVQNSAISVVAAPIAFGAAMPIVTNMLIKGNHFYSDMTSRRGMGVSIRSLASNTTPNEFMDTLQFNDNIVIQDNVFDDLGTAIWATATHGEISNNQVNRTSEEGIVTCGGWKIDNNHLVDLYQTPTGPTGFFTTFRTGILHYTYQRAAVRGIEAATFHGTITNNRVELDYDVFLNLATDKAIYVLGGPNNNDDFTLIHNGVAMGGGLTTITLDVGASARDDFYLGCMVTFTNDVPPGIIGQYSTAPITAYNGTTKVATVPSWSGLAPAAGTAFRIDRVNRGGAEVVDGNFAGYATGGASMLAMSNIRVHAYDARVNKNTCSTLEVWGTDCTVKDNSVVNLGVNYDVNGAVPNPDRAYDDRNLVSGNTVDNGFYPWKYTTATDNQFINTVTTPAGSNNVTFTGNWFKLSLIMGDATGGLVANNTFDFGMTLGATVASTNLRVMGNTTKSSIVIGAVAQVASSAIIANNHVHDSTGLLGITTYADRSTIQGNNTVYDIVNSGFIATFGGHNTIMGNTTGDVYVAGGQNITKGNKFLGDMTIAAVADNNMISDNFGLTGGAGIIYVKCNDTVITGNMVNKIEFADGLARSVLTGNMVNGDIALSVGGGAPNADSVVVSGNWIFGNVTAGNGALAANSAIAMGNRAGATILAVATTAGNVVNGADNATV